MEELYCIKATNRRTGVREIITYPMPLKKAKAWKPTPLKKIYHKNFRVCKYKKK